MAQDFADRLNSFEKKWQEKWRSEEIFQPDPNDDDKFFITVAYPYPSGAMHLGHVRTFTLPDVFARFKRMQGYNVLFPMAWHVTGTPIIGALDRLKEGEEEQIETIRDTFGVPENEFESWEEPMDFANYFIENSYKKNMKRLGFSVDWRREFNTNQDQYNRFIEWQYRSLKDQGLVNQDTHPTKYCLNDQNPVTDHDLLEGETAEKQEYSLVKFRSGGRVFPMATLRPETVYGVTHTLINPEEDYVVAEVDDEEWVISREAAEKLRHQERDVEVQEEKRGEEFIGEKVQNPVTGEEVLIVPATFVEPDSGSGIVMSVPAHAPYDWISLKDLKEDTEMLEKYGLDPEEVQSIEPKTIIDVEGYGDNPAKEACEDHGVESQDDEEALEEATDEVYEKEFHTGRLNANCQDFAGEKVSAVKDRLTQQFENMGRFSSMYDFSEEVVCRCGGKVIVSMQETWFLDYGNVEWKEKVRENLSDMDLIPENIRNQFDHQIDWLEEWPAIRNYGLGTDLPFDEEFKIEPLSDSTIYMSFYTIRHIIRDIDDGKLTQEFFDHVFQGEGTAEEVAKETGIDAEKVEEARESFDYWYPLDWRTSANELIQNHLTFFMFHHTALFDREYWPEGIATWGMGLLEGEKMSSSKGHVVLAEEAIDNYGADTTRFFLFASVEPWQDFDWRSDEVEEYRKKLRRFYNRTLDIHGSGEDREMNDLDRYVMSRLQKIERKATEGLEEFQTRKAGMNAFFEINSLVNKYRNRADTLNSRVVSELVEDQIKLLAPFTPHICEELWTETGHEGLVAEAEWPEPDDDLMDQEVEDVQGFLETTVEDIRELSDIVGEFEEIKIIAAGDWKRDVFSELQDLVEERPEFGEAMGRLVDGRKEHADQIKSYLQEYLEEPGDLPERVFSGEREVKILEENTGFLEEEFDAEVLVELESESSEEKAGRAEPGKPAIVLE
ncbi:MAG: leucine--tRNA ligase [Candidatus Nanohaloarchaea archaeon]